MTGLEPVAALLAIALDPSLGSVAGLSMQAVHLLVSPDLLPLLAKPTDPEQVMPPWTHQHAMAQVSLLTSPCILNGYSSEWPASCRHLIAI